MPSNERKFHCQICARTIKAKNGIIAHHGYTRPGTGWQTPSCIGARYQPYEVACDRLPIAIASATAYREQQEKALAALVYGVPLPNPRYTDWLRNKTSPYAYERARVAGKAEPAKEIVPELNERGYPKDLGFGQTYKTIFAYREYEIGRDIKAVAETIAFFQARLAAWVAPLGE